MLNATGLHLCKSSRKTPQRRDTMVAKAVVSRVTGQHRPGEQHEVYMGPGSCSCLSPHTTSFFFEVPFLVQLVSNKNSLVACQQAEVSLSEGQRGSLSTSVTLDCSIEPMWVPMRATVLSSLAGEPEACPNSAVPGMRVWGMGQLCGNTRPRGFKGRHLNRPVPASCHD